MGSIIKNSISSELDVTNANLDLATGKTTKLKAIFSGLGLASKQIFSKVQGTPFNILSEGDFNDKILELARATQQGTEAQLKYANSIRHTGLLEYVNEVDVINATFPDYIKHVQAANHAIKQTALSAKIAAGGMKLLTIAMNVGIMLLVSTAIQEVVKGIDSLVHAQENAIETTRELSDKWKALNIEISEGNKSIGVLAPEYIELSKGVDSLGKSISLGSDKYERHNVLANQIAELLPDLVQGYTDTGTAILSTTESVEGLTKAYRDNAMAKAAAFLSESAKDIVSGVNAQLDYDPFFGIGYSGTTQQIAALQKILDNIDAGNLFEVENALYEFRKEIDDISKGAGIDIPLLSSVGDKAKAFKENEDALRAYLKTLENAYKSQASILSQIPNMYLMSSAQYWDLTSDTKAIVSRLISSLDTEFYQGRTIDGIKVWVQENVLDAFSETNFQSSLSNVLESQTAFDTNKMSLGEYTNSVKEFTDSISSLSPEVKKAFADILSTDVTPLITYIKSMLSDEFDNMVDTLTLEDIKIAYKLENTGELTWDEFLNNLAEAKKALPIVEAFSEDDTLKNLTKSFENRIDRIQALKDSLQDAIDDTITTGKKVLTDDYADVIEQSNAKLSELYDEQYALISGLNKWTESGEIVEGTDQWHEWQSAIEGVNAEITKEERGIRDLNAAIQGMPLAVLQTQLERIKAAQSSKQGEMDILEARDETPSNEQYLRLIELAETEISLHEAINAELRKQQQGMDLVSDAYRDLQSDIDSNNDAIQSSRKSQEEWKKAVKETSSALEKWRKAKDAKETGDDYRDVWLMSRSCLKVLMCQQWWRETFLTRYPVSHRGYRR